MDSQLEYDVSVHRLLPATVAVFALFALPAFLTSSAQAQVNGTPASVTSPGFGGRAINGPPASVTSPGFGGNVINGPRASVSSVGPRGYAPGDGYVHHRHHNFVPYTPPVAYFVPLPYAVDMGAADEEANPNAPADEAAEGDQNDQGGPTVFDRRGAGASSYVPPVPPMREAAPAHPAQNAEEAAAAAPEPLEPTTLVFKDGHKLEVSNYAIIGPTLFDMTPGHARKVALKELDLEATRRENDERGVTFQLPLSSQSQAN
jgi:hypothetical protein